MISVAAELAEMHPQTLRMYEQRGLIEPQRSPKGTRLYSQADVERLRRIQEMTAELGMNLAGVERVFELEEQLEAMSAKVRRLDERARRAEGGGRAARAAAPLAARRDRPLRAARSATRRSRARSEQRRNRLMQLDRFTIKSQEAIQAALRLAEERRNPQATPEHLLAVLLEQQDGIVAPVLRKVGADPGAIRSATSVALDALPTMSGPSGGSGPAEELMQVLRAAEHEMRQLSDEYVSTEHLLLSLSGHNSKAGEVLREGGASHDDAAAGDRRGARPAPRHRHEPGGQVPGAREVRPRPHGGRRATASSTR